MASKRPPPLDDPPSASSDEDDETEDEQETITQKTIQQSESEDDENDDEEEEEEESESEEQTPLSTKKPQIPNPNSKSESEEEEDDDEEEEEESVEETQNPKSSSIFEFKPDIKSPSASNFAIKPSKKITPEKKPALKRPSVNLDQKNKKKVKASNGDENKSSSVIKRVWSEEDELMLLQGFIDYQAKNGCSPLSDMDSFYQFTMDSLPGNASKSQLYEKVRRLKKKFRVNEEKVTATGEDPVFVKPHERTLFEVSKKIWGINGCETVGNVNGSTVKPKARSIKPKPKAEVKVKHEKEVEVVDDEMLVQVKDFETLYPYWSAGLNLAVSSSLNFPTGIVGWFREDLSLIEEAKATEMNEKWKEHFEKEAVLQMRKKALLSKVSTQ